jgi:hypothetical protein
VCNLSSQCRHSSTRNWVNLPRVAATSWLWSSRLSDGLAGSSDGRYHTGIARKAMLVHLQHPAVEELTMRSKEFAS